MNKSTIIILTCIALAFFLFWFFGINTGTKITTLDFPRVNTTGHNTNSPDSPNVPAGNNVANIVTPAGPSMNAGINITTTNTQPVLKNLFGIQTRSFFDGLMYDRYNTNVYNNKTGIYTPEKRLMKNVYDLKINSYRYPGGTFARYVHPGQKGYGINANDINTDNSSFKRDWFGGGDISSYITYQNTLPDSFSKTLSDIAKSTGPGRTVTVVANLVYGSPAETVAQIKKFLDEGTNVAGVEMGNEHYSATPGIGMPVATYLAKAKEHAKAVKDAYPNLDIGLVAATAYPTYPADRAYYPAWNIAVANAINTENCNGVPCYSAFVYHLYKPIKCIPSGASINKSLIDCAIYKENILGKTTDKVTADKASSWGTVGTLPLAEAFSYYRSVFGENTKVWLTEWGLSPETGASEKGNVYSNTLLFGTYMVDFYNFINEYNVNHNNTIQMAYYHNLAGGIGDSVIGVQEPGETFRNYTDSKYNLHIPWFALKIIRPIYNAGNVAIAQTNVSSTIQYLSFNSYIDRTNNFIYLYFTNKSGSNIKIPSISVDAKTLDIKTIKAHEEIVSGSSVFSGNGQTYFDVTGMQLPISYGVADGADIESTVIPAYSFGFIQFKKP